MVQGGASIVVDDLYFPSSDYSGTQWTHEQGQGSAYNGTLTICNADDKGTTVSQPSFDMNFYGTDIFIYGTFVDGVSMNYTIDQTTLRPAVFTPNRTRFGKPGGELWSLKDLDNATYHTLQLFPSAGQLVIDYITYTPSRYTTLIANDLIIDDQSPALQYSSGWRNTTKTEFPTGIPYLRTTTGTSAKGSTMKFNFIGSSISVYGALQQADGGISASFSVDGGTSTTYAPFDGTQAVNSSSWLVSQQFYHQDLVPGNHTLLVTLDDVSGSQTLWIDSVVFEGTSATTLTSSGLPITTSSSSTTASSSHANTFSNAAIGGIIAAILVVLFAYGIIRQKIKARRLRLRAMSSSSTFPPISTNPGLHGPSPPRPPPILPTVDIWQQHQAPSPNQPHQDGPASTPRNNRTQGQNFGTAGSEGDREGDVQRANVSRSRAQEDGRDDDPIHDIPELGPEPPSDPPPAYTDDVYER